MKYFRHIKSVGTVNKLVPTTSLNTENLIVSSFLSSPAGNITPEFGASQSLVCFYTFITYVCIDKRGIAVFYTSSNYIVITSYMYHSTFCFCSTFYVGMLMPASLIHSFSLLYSYYSIAQQYHSIDLFSRSQTLAWGNRISMPVH